jgi:hypothetical protein
VFTREALFSRIPIIKYTFLLLAFLSVLGGSSLPAAQAAPIVLYGHLTKEAAESGATACHDCAFKGLWSCLTQVTSSNIEGIYTGVEATSCVRFVNSDDGSIVAAWAQDGWSNSCAPLTLVSCEEASISRANIGLGENAGYREESFDHYLRTGPTEMVVVSRVRMYAGDSYAGTYTTRSILRRIEPDGSLFICHHEATAQE